ncbi:MAG TPA: M28 family metallopeptidase [Anaerolineae bacterium]|nr:M28 family metallopeptidase [Anaerolineae bacterium]
MTINTRSWLSRAILILAILALAGCSLPAVATPTPAPAAQLPAATATTEPTTPPPTATAAPTDPPATAVPDPDPTATATTPPPTSPPTAAVSPFDLISLDQLFVYLEDLTAIQPYSGWRNSGTEGEAEALEYVAAALGDMPFLAGLGLELERQEFHVFLATELWDTSLTLTVAGREVEVPADGLRGPRDDIAPALRFDSDGVLNDADRDPVSATGAAIVIRSESDLNAITPADVRGKIILLDYALVDRSIYDTGTTVRRASEIAAREPAGIVLITEFSNIMGESHGAFVGDGSAFHWVSVAPNPPVLYARLEDLAPAGITTWDDLADVESASLTWDADVFSPGTSRNLIARIPGADSSRAMILGAHIDSPNAPGAMDDGSGSAVLLEVARVLDASATRPPVDLYLAWFGSEELGLYGASHFVSTHQELLDRTIAMLQIDCLTRPLDGVRGDLALVAWPVPTFNPIQEVWLDYLAGAAARQGVETRPEERAELYSDNASFIGYDVPNLDLIYEPFVGRDISVHYAGHIHDPYDTVELAREVGDVLEEMAHVALTAALHTPRDNDSLRTSPTPEHRAVVVASHSELVHMTPATWRDLGMGLAAAGYDVDLVPYGQAVTAADLEGAALVIALPVIDYPSPDGDLTPYDEAWTEAEVAVLEEYVAAGGFLILSNSAHRLKYGTAPLDLNEDWIDVNALAEAFGIVYGKQTLAGGTALIDSDHPLVGGVREMVMSEGNAHSFTLPEGENVEILAVARDRPAAALLSHGSGHVLVLADAATLATGFSAQFGHTFWRDLGTYVAGNQ